MTEPQRLFDCINYQLENGALEDMFASKEGGQWKKYSTYDVREITNRLSCGLLKIGLSGGDMSEEGRDKIAILSKNRPEWLILDFAVQQIGAILVPVYPTINVNELQFVLNDSKVKVVFVNDEETFHRVSSIKENVPSLQNIFSFEHVVNAKYWKEILIDPSAADLQRIQQISSTIKHEDLATILYTSGTTGTPKGVMLSHRNVISNVMSCIPCFPRKSDIRALSFLPLNHILERMVSYLYLFRRVSIYYAESMDTIGENLREIKPHIFTSVPRVLEKVYDRIMNAGRGLTGVKRKLFFWAHGLAEKYEINKNMGAWYNMKLAIANKLVFKKWRDAIGGNLLCIVSGGAACQVRLIRIFTAAKIPIMEGYGLTETSPVITVNRFEVEKRRFGTVGPIIDGVDVKIAEDGEILCKGPNIMMGYYKRPDLTADVTEGDWFKTGDIGILSTDRFLSITDRKKELFKTSGGKYVAPVAIENKLKESQFIEQAMVVGSERKFVGALIVPAFPHLRDWAKSQGIDDTTNKNLFKNAKVIALYKDIVENFNKYFNHVEQIKRFELLPSEWTVDTGEMTPKLSLKRKVIMEKFKDAIERIYA